MSAPTPKPLLLDPFAFPSETKGRFRMLIVTAFALAWSLVSYFIAVPNPQVISLRTDEAAQAAIDKAKAQWGFEGFTFEDVLRVGQSRAIKDLYRALLYELVRIPFAIFLVLTVVVATAWLYLRHPAREWRRYGLTELDPESAPTVVAHLRSLAERAGLSPALRLALRPGALDGLAFGRRRREVVALSGHPRLLEKTWNGFAQAIALHELGHVANDDVWNREVSNALWRTLRVVVVVLAITFAALSWHAGELHVPILGEELFGEQTTTPTHRLLVAMAQTSAIFLVMGWVWAELIRTREFYADWRAAAWGSRDALLKRLRLPSSSAPWQQWRAWRHHPSNAVRHQMLENPASLFRVSPQLALMTGLLVTVLLGQLASFFNDLTYAVTAVSAPFLMLLGPFVLLGGIGVAAVVTFGVTYLITGALGVQIQREAIFDLATRPHSDWRYLRFGFPALLFAIGIEMGLLLTPWGFQTHPAPLETLGWLAGFAGLVWLWLIYLRAMSRFWLGTRPGVAVPVLAQRVLRWLATVLLGALLWPALIARVALHVAADQRLRDALTMTSATPQHDQFIMVFVMSSLVLLVGALMFYLVVVGFSLAVAAVGLWLRKVRCPSCGESGRAGLLVGRRCGGCGTPLAQWMYLSRV